MDFHDTPDEAEFRRRLRAWLVDNNPHLAVMGGTAQIQKNPLAARVLGLPTS